MSTQSPEFETKSLRIKTALRGGSAGEKKRVDVRQASGRV